MVRSNDHGCDIRSIVPILRRPVVLDMIATLDCLLLQGLDLVIDEYGR